MRRPQCLNRAFNYFCIRKYPNFYKNRKMSYNRTKWKGDYTKIILSKKLGDEAVARIVEDDVLNIVGKKIRRFRKMRHMSQQELSDKLEMYAIYVCRGSISRIESHQRTVTDYELKAMAEVLQVSVGDLFE